MWLLKKKKDQGLLHHLTRLLMYPEGDREGTDIDEAPSPKWNDEQQRSLTVT